VWDACVRDACVGCLCGMPVRDACAGCLRVGCMIVLSPVGTMAESF